MRILLVGDYPRDARLGSTKVLFKLQEEFRTMGHVCDVMLADDLGDFPRHRLLRWALSPVLALAAVRRAWRRSGPFDVIDVASAEGLWIGVLRRAGMFDGAAVVARSNGLEHLNYARMLADHDAGILRKPWTRRWWYPAVRLSQVAAAARVADRLIVLNDADRAFALERGWKREATIDVVAHGVSTKFLAGAPGPDQPRGAGILFCGTWDSMKGVQYLADAFSRLIDAGRSVRLTVLGAAMPEDTVLAAFTPAARRFVSVRDRVPEEQVIDAYRRHDVMAFPSSYEGFGMVLIEAMSQRLPVVATPVGAAAAFVRDGDTGLVVPPRDPAALAAALSRMLDDPPLRARLADAAFGRVRDLTWTRTASETLAVYQHARDAKHEALAHA